MATRPITLNSLLSKPPPPKPVSGVSRPSLPNIIEAANAIRAQAAAGNVKAVIPKGVHSPTIKRGRLSIPAQGRGRTFMFNPNDVSDTKAINWGSIEVPGASHPVYQFGAGGERLISFELYIDGDRGRFGRDGSGRDTSSLSIKDELHWYRSLVYPTSYGQGFAGVAPYVGGLTYDHVVIFNYGELYQGVPCIVKKADWKINYWAPNPENGGQPIPVRATVSMALAEVVDKSQTSLDVRMGWGGRP